MQFIQENQNLRSIQVDTLKITKGLAQQYINPVQIKYCQHVRDCFELDEVVKQFNNHSNFICEICKQSANTIADLVWDVRYHAYQEFHKSVDTIHIINGILINYYWRKDIYLKPFYNVQIRDWFLKSYQKNEIFDYSSKSYNGNIEFLGFCLLDNVQINIPVRIRGCTHLECYELTSLLHLQNNNSLNPKTFKCNHKKCGQKLDISSLDTFFSQIYIDVQLLKMIKKSNRISIKIKYNKQTQSLEPQIQSSIRELFDEFQNKYSQQRIELDELQCQNLEQFFSPILQNNLMQEDEVLKKKLIKNCQSSQSISMIDQITQLPFEIPTRCKYCTDLNKSLDLKTYVFDFFLKKKLNKNVYKYQCPLCNHSQLQTIQVANLNKYIYIDSFLIKQMRKFFNVGVVQSQSNIKRLDSVVFDTVSLLNPYTNVRYANPALTKGCIHHNFCFEMEEALEEIWDHNFYQCPQCTSLAYSPNDLVYDWRVNAYKEFNEYTKDVTIIAGIVVNQYTRNKRRYQEFFTQTEYITQFKQMFDRVSKDSSISTLIQKDLQQQNSNKQQKINFWSFCLQDKVNINIPVRILGCKHYECYELTSLLFYQEQNRKKKEFLECKQPGCSNRLRIAHKDYTKQYNTPEMEEQEKILDVQILFSGIRVDQELLTAIKISNPSSYKFKYNYYNQIIEEDINLVQGRLVDPFIYKFYEQHPDLQNKMQFQDFQKLISQQAIQVSQGDLLQEDQKLSKQVALYRYRNYTVNMKDKFTELTIEYPVRCKSCKNLEVCIDMRSYIAEFNYQIKMFPTKAFSCPLCKHQLSKQTLSMKIQNYIYLDSNMLSFMFKDMSYVNGTNIFEYQGEQYIFQEFLDRQKIKRETYVAGLQDKKVLFRQLFCLVNPNQKIKQPLILQKCPDRNIVDFTSFYEELKKINFDYENYGLILCKCAFCGFNPIKTFVGNIYFHEAFYEALNKFYKIEELKNDTEFSYQFEDTEQKSYVINKQQQYKIKLIMG
ncbi:unnamed protein product (macronuclear) [Paramecium tetraurelia]|uniref:Uncharacterized protein n=1 Tax=Paramecium tetraurelia TaxID=5888 RepID=A0DE82_PARTE|nr:uncharacterized protein GSPATT00016191001 [Paramecium tetraurelia]CAK81349.1 unnamed protein product [Paramecium tetraurelia]|eukprot:XP_001448746.1 hypothetical protein (macronuclear) [Paramecium tetraurelia strain d4-2]